MKSLRRWVCVCVLALSALSNVAASSDQPVPINERARGAFRVVVATVTDTSARYERNEFGDELIFTYAQLDVEEAIKGPQGAATLAIEGGTVNGITLRVSSMPTLSKGERAVFFLTPGRSDEFRAYLKGQGILKLNAENRVPGTSLTLDEIRRQAKSVAK